MVSDCTEDVYMKGFVGGEIKIYMNGKSLYGTIRTHLCSASITVYGGTISNNEGATGIIHPNVGLSFDSRAVSVGFEATQYGALYNVRVFAPDNLPSDIEDTQKVCIASQSGTGCMYCKNVEIVNATIGFRASNCGNMHINSSSGVASKYGFQAITGGVISIANNNQAGARTSRANEESGGQVRFEMTKPTFQNGNPTTDSSSAPVISDGRTITIKSSYGDTYRSSGWKQDGTARCGQSNYGNCSGYWFFGGAFSEVQGMAIKKVEIIITRQDGGSLNDVELLVNTHEYSDRPNGAPSYRASAGYVSIAPGNTGVLTILDKTILNEISSGTVKGFGIQTTYDSAHYAICSGSCTVKITY